MTIDPNAALHDMIRATAERASHAARVLAVSSTKTRNAILAQIVVQLESSIPAILSANAEDVREAREAVEQGMLAPSLVDRLILDATKVHGMIASVRAVSALDDPIHRTLHETQLDDGLVLQQCTVPFGVLAAIFESRPDAVTQIAALAIKSGNAVILKGGREAVRSTQILVQCIRDAIATISDSLADAVLAVDGREAVSALLAMDDLIDLIIPRGSTALVRDIQSRTHIPVLGHAAGVCHVYFHASADVAMAADIVVDSKAQSPSACNAAETVLVDIRAAGRLFPHVMDRLARASVEVRCCAQTLAVLASLDNEITRVKTSQESSGVHLQKLPVLSAATGEAWDTEYGSLIINCKLVDGIDEALAHIRTHGSRHTETIVAEDAQAASQFLATVDAAGVFHNASTRFADGYRYGLGAEVGISTSKLHARGPVGLTGLTTTKYVLRGHGHVVAPYTGSTPRPFLHAKA